jgi:DNA-directed RNA polymerase specialized sigma24 family protein
MLEELAKKDSQWRKMALHICKDKNTADDLVQNMYLYLASKEGVFDDGYIYFTIKSIYTDSVKKTSLKNRVVLVSEFPNEIYFDEYDFDNDNKKQSEIDNLTKTLEENTISTIIVKNSFNDGLRKFSRESGISINTVKKFRNEFKNKLWQRK